MNRTKNNTAQVAELSDNLGKVLEGTTYGARQERSEDFYVQPGQEYANRAVDGQQGTKLVTGSNLTQANNDYERYTETITLFPDDPEYQADLPVVSGGSQAAAQSAAPVTFGGEAAE